MKFINLLKKELKELINTQMIIGLVVSFAMLMMLSGFMTNAMEEIAESQGSVNICDNDNTEFTQSILSYIEQTGTEVKLILLTNDDSISLLQKNDLDNLVIIPKGFTESVLEKGEVAELEVITAMKDTSVMSQMDGAMSNVAVELISMATKQTLLSEQYNISGDDIARLNTPVITKEVTVVGSKSAEISSSVITNFVSSQGMIVPIVIFVLVIFASQMIVSAISTEKIDKTLETLLSAPVSRISVLGAKMLAAAMVSLINAVVYMFGFSKYMGAMMGESLTAENISEALTVSEAMSILGLKMTASGYFLLGLQMFLTIMISLSISIMLGAMVTDAKSAQTVIMPLMFGAMIPYFVSMFSNINTLSTPVKLLLYAIPFTHTFNATNNILFGDMTAFWAGFGYQCVFLLVCLTMALKLFTSDKIFTVSLNFGQKIKFAKSSK